MTIPHFKTIGLFFSPYPRFLVSLSTVTSTGTVKGAGKGVARATSKETALKA
mgnify:CR=1 FL=1